MRAPFDSTGVWIVDLAGVQPLANAESQQLHQWTTHVSSAPIWHGKYRHQPACWGRELRIRRWCSAVHFRQYRPQCLAEPGNASWRGSCQYCLLGTCVKYFASNRARGNKPLSCKDLFPIRTAVRSFAAVLCRNLPLHSGDQIQCIRSLYPVCID